MTYHERVLQPGETILAVGQLHWIIFLPSIAWLIASMGFVVAGDWLNEPTFRLGLTQGALLCAAMGLVGFGAAAIRRWVTEIVVTDRRVILKRGLVIRYTIEMNISQIEAVNLNQGIPARVLGYGTLLIQGSGGGIEPLRLIDAPIAIRNAIPVG